MQGAIQLAVARLCRSLQGMVYCEAVKDLAN